MIAEPLDKGIAEDIESGRVSIKQPVRLLGKYFQDKYNWVLLASCIPGHSVQTILVQISSRAAQHFPARPV